MGRKPRRSLSKVRTAVVVLRVSTDGERQALGADAQRAAVEAWAAREGVSVLAWHLDEVTGGAPLDERAGLLAGLADVQAHKPTFLAFSTLDRFSRDPISAALVEAELARHGTELVFADGSGNGSDPTAEMVRGIRLVVARFERKLIAARIKAALAVKQARGEMTGAAPYGMRAVDGPMRAGRDGTMHPVQMLEVDPAEQAVIALVRELRAEELSIRDVAAELEARGVLGRAGTPLTRDAVHKIVQRTEPTVET